MRLLLGFAFVLAAVAQTGTHPVTLVTSDLENFWKAYDASQPGHRAEAFQKLYLDTGSPGLKDFVDLRIRSAQTLADAVDKQYPKFYASVRKYTMQVDAHRAAILKSLSRFQELYPEASFPTVYFVIGRLSSGGTTSDRGLLIGTEVNSLGPDVDTSEINPPYLLAMGTADRLPLIVVHELTHTQSREPAAARTAPTLPDRLGIGDRLLSLPDLLRSATPDSVNHFAPSMSSR